MWLVDSNYNFECDWLIELSDNKLSDNKLSDNNLTSELVENRSFFKPITTDEIVIFMIKNDNVYVYLFFPQTFDAMDEDGYLYACYYVSLIVIGSFFVLNLVLGVLSGWVFRTYFIASQLTRQLRTLSARRQISRGKQLVFNVRSALMCDLKRNAKSKKTNNGSWTSR